MGLGSPHSENQELCFRRRSDKSELQAPIKEQDSSRVGCFVNGPISLDSASRERRPKLTDGFSSAAIDGEQLNLPL
jgi:hypothetical protein